MASTFEKKFDFNGYQVVSVSYEGATGDVYQALNLETQQKVFIHSFCKAFPSIDYSSLPSRDSFFAGLNGEASVLKKIIDPHVLKIIGTGFGNNSPCIVTDFRDGKFLAQLLDDNCKLPIETVFKILQQLASIIDEIHNSGIVHGLINTSSIIVTEKNDECFLTNFCVYNFLKNGIGKEHGGGVALSDLCYFSPEQISEKRFVVGSDIYSLAVVAFECLSGTKPFRGESFSDLCNNIVNKKPISFSSITSYPLSMEAVFTKAFSKDIRMRHKSAKEFVDDLIDAYDPELYKDEIAELTDIGTQDTITPLTKITSFQIKKNRCTKKNKSLISVKECICGFLFVIFLGLIGGISSKYFEQRKNLDARDDFIFFKKQGDLRFGYKVNFNINNLKNTEIASLLKYVKEKKVVDFLDIASSFLRHKDYQIRIMTVKTLRSLNSAGCEDLLIETLNDVDPIVRGNVANALGAIGSEKSIEYLSEALKNEKIKDVKITFSRAIDNINARVKELGNKD